MKRLTFSFKIIVPLSAGFHKTSQWDWCRRIPTVEGLQS